MLARVIRKVRRVLRERSRLLRDRLAATYLAESPWQPGTAPRIGTGRIAGLFAQDLTADDAARAKLIADKALRHEFDLLGSGWVQVAHGMKCAGLAGHRYDDAEQPAINSANETEAKRIRTLLPPDYVPIDWHRDFKSGYRWSEKTWYERIPIGHLPGVDVKVPWELGRLQHLPCLGWAFARSKRQDYAAEFRNQVLDFVAANPPRWGVNWRCTMDVAIRVANLIVAFDLFQSAGASWDDEFLSQFWRSLGEHGLHIRTNLEWHPTLRGNHYLCDIVGLLGAAAYLPATTMTSEWLQFAAHEVEKELVFQFHLDGSNFEASTFYHRLSSEAMFFATAVIEEVPRNLAPLLPDWQRERLRRLQRFSEETAHCRVGDNDSGFFFALPLRARVAAPAACPRLTPRDGWECHAFPLFGLYIYRSPRMQLSIRCGPVGQNGNGGHAHNDQLSFELSVDGLPFLVDPGTYVYSPLPGDRNKYRSTAMHNTLALEGREQNTWLPGLRGLFQLHDQCRPQVLALSNAHFTGVHHGFTEPHRRSFDLFRHFICCRDVCAIAGEKQIHFHLAPAVQAAMEGDGHAARLMNGTASLAFRSEDGRLALRESCYAPAYGVQIPTRVLLLQGAAATIEWTIEIPA